LVTASAGLETGKINQDSLIEDTGEIKVGDYRYGTWNFDQHGKKEGFIGLIKAIAKSNDIFFYTVGEMVGVENLKQWSNALSLGQKTGIELAGEVAGQVPDPVWKERTTGERWFLGNTYHMSIGQGDLLTTPLQLNRMTAAVLSGQVCPPRLSGGDSRQGCRSDGLSSAHRELILAGMKQACQPGGTAFPFFQFQPEVACKTGTAQHGGEKTAPHAWITVVIPSGGGTALANYEGGLVITVLLEEAGEGSYEAGPIAKAVAEYVIAQKL
jgi:penicillin-binding protein 2